MKKSKTIILGLGFILLFVVAYYSYGALSKKFKEEQIKQQNSESTGKESGEVTNDIDANNKGTDNLGGNVLEDSLSEEVAVADDFTVTDMKGNEVKLSDFFGKPIVLNFWASWCPPCKAEMPHFQKLYEEMGDEVQFLMVDLADGYQETVEKGSAYIEENKYTFPVYFDTKLDAAYTYTIYSIPATYFIDRSGVIVDEHLQYFDNEDDLREKIENIME